MKPSISRYLLINLLSVAAIIIIASAVAIYYYGVRDIHRQLDKELVHSGFVFQALFSTIDTNTMSVQQIQKAFNDIPIQERYFLLDNPEFKNLFPSKTDFNSTFRYQVWDQQGNLILHSVNAPATPLSEGDNGLTNTFIQGNKWHVFTIHDRKTNYTIIVASQLDKQNSLRISILQHDLILIFIMFPVAGLFVWLTLLFTLKKLKKLTDEVSHRAPDYLEPVDIEKVPREVEPLVLELNKFFGILKDAFARDKRFAADAAHELKTPLAAMKTQAQVALKASNPERRTTAIENVIAGVDRSTHIVQQLLTLNRLGPGSSIKKQKLDLEPIIREILAELAPNALHKNIELDFKAAQYPAWIYADKASMAILVRNLIDNAIRYTFEDGKVHVSIINTPQHVIFRVTDTGPGIPPKLRDRIFERFFRVLGTKQSGSGLGLAIVHQIAQLHAAEINLETPPSGFGLQIEIRFKHS